MMPRILNKELLRKAEPYILPAVVLLVGLCSFGLGRLSAVEGTQMVIRLPDERVMPAATYFAENAPVVAPQKPALISGRFVASKSGLRYYLTTCSGAARIKEENKVWFESIADAQAAGYTPAVNCPGL